MVYVVVAVVGAGSQSVGRGVTARSVQDYIEGFGGTAQESTSTASAAPAPPSPPIETVKLEPRQLTPDREITGKDGAPMVLVPAGEFMMGAQQEDGMAGRDERPDHSVYLDAYYIDQHEVTTTRYAKFFQETKRTEPLHWSGQVLKRHARKPMVGVDWNDAAAYCSWVGKRLPTEAEWEKAARGMDNRLYPWGNEFDSLKCNSESLGINDTTPVGIFPAGASPYGVLDMAGNVSEWTRSIYGYWTKRQKGMKLLFLYPYIVDDGREDIDKPDNWVRTLRGGNYCSDMATCTVTYRRWDSPNVMASDFYGFRCVVHY